MYRAMKTCKKENFHDFDKIEEAIILGKGLTRFLIRLFDQQAKYSLKEISSLKVAAFLAIALKEKLHNHFGDKENLVFVTPRHSNSGILQMMEKEDISIEFLKSKNDLSFEN